MGDTEQGFRPEDFQIDIVAVPKTNDQSGRTRLSAFLDACRARPEAQWPPERFRVAPEADAVRVVMEIDLPEQLGPIIEKLAVANGLELRLSALDAVVAPSDPRAASSSVWAAVSLRAAELARAIDSGKPSLPAAPYKYVRVTDIDGTRVATANIPAGRQSKRLGIGPTKYDDWEWHAGGEFPPGRPESQGFVHLGLYLTWLIQNDLVDPMVFEAPIVEAVRARALLATELAENVDGKLISTMLSDEGAAFTDVYYAEDEPRYFADLVATFGDQVDAYSIPATWESYDLIAPVIDRQLATWRMATRSQD